MFENLYPKEYVRSVRDIDFKELFEDGYRGVIFDIDNTLVPHNAPADESIMGFFDMLNKTGFKTFLLSNNAEERAKRFCEDVSAEGYIYKAGKPSPKGYLKAAEDMGLKATEVIFVGDQIFTDIWGANNAGIRSIMVEPVKKWKEEIQIILKRFLEYFVIISYKKRIQKKSAPS